MKQGNNSWVSPMCGEIDLRTKKVRKMIAELVAQHIKRTSIQFLTLPLDALIGEAIQAPTESMAWDYLVDNTRLALNKGKYQTYANWEYAVEV